jgi:surface carbohydrate biosynthesis protein
MPDIVMLNNARVRVSSFIAKLSQTGIKVGVLENSGGGWPSPEEYVAYLCKSKDADLLKYLSCICFWGPKLAEEAIKRGLLTSDQAVVTGCSRFDYYAPMWRSVFTQEADGQAASANVRILLTATHIPSLDADPAATEMQRRYYRDVLGWTDQRIQRWFECSSRATVETIELARNLARDFPRANIVVRPHPYTDPKLYHQQLSGLENVEINTSGPVQAQIIRAVAVIQRGCTTGIEAAMASVPAFSPQWVPDSELVVSAESVSEGCETYEQLRKRLDAAVASQYTIPVDTRANIDQLIRDWFYRIDGLSHLRESAAILNCLNGNVGGINEASCATYLKEGQKIPTGLWARCEGSLRARFDLSPSWSFRRMMPGKWAGAGWSRSGTNTYFDVTDVVALSKRIHEACLSQGKAVQTVKVATAQERGDYSHEYRGYSVALSC